MFKVNYMDRWFADGAERLRYEYDLKPESIVMDLGVYKGEFAEKIVNKYNCYVYGFEPISMYYCLASRRLEKYENIKLYNFGIGCKSSFEIISIMDDSSSLYKSEGPLETIEIKSISDVMESLCLVKIDLIKINVEGCEYDILESIIDNNMVRLFQNIQVQFHNFVPGAFERRNNIVEKLKETHIETFSYPFVWESFKLER